VTVRFSLDPSAAVHPIQTAALSFGAVTLPARLNVRAAEAVDPGVGAAVAPGPVAGRSGGTVSAGRNRKSATVSPLVVDVATALGGSPVVTG